MKKIVLIFGLIAGFIISTTLFISIWLASRGYMELSGGELIGYSSMVLAFMLVFFGIRSYRDNVAGGSVTFGKAFKVGILITIVASLCYVVTWELIYFNFAPDFAERMSAAYLEELRGKGASAAEIEEKRQMLAKMKTWYDNPLINAAVTLIEPFPVGLLATLISAGILRRRSPDVALATA